MFDIFIYNILDVTPIKYNLVNLLVFHTTYYLLSVESPKKGHTKQLRGLN